MAYHARMTATTPASDADLRAEILRLAPWHYDIELAPGIRTGAPVPAGTYAAELGTPTVIPQHYIAQTLEVIFPGGLAGRSMLDCACNAGAYLFEGARNGAGRSFGFDVREHWIRQARFLSRYLPSENIEFAVRDLMTLPELALEPFDITIFSGILYHLPDPVAGLRIAADLTRELIIVNTDVLPSRIDGLVLSPESTVEVMSGVHGLAWLPTGERPIRAMLASCGFPHARVIFDHSTTYGRRRMGIMGARDAATFRDWDRTEHAMPRTTWRDRIRRVFGRR